MVFTTFDDTGFITFLKHSKLQELLTGKPIVPVIQRLVEVVNSPNKDISGGQLLMMIAKE